MSTLVVYVHGLWLPGAESFLLRRRLGQALAAETRAFAYSSMRSGLVENAGALACYLAACRADTVHVVAHSLGGLVVLGLFEAANGNGALAYPPGRIVFLGAPVCGSVSARRLARWPFGRGLLGRSAGDGLLSEQAPRWAGARDLGIIVGDSPVGAGRLLGPLRGPNDGTVSVEETLLPGATQRLVLPVNHSGMVFSPTVARHTASFLQRGRFE